MPPRIVQSKQNARLKQLRKALANPARESRSRAPLLAGGGPLVLAGIEGPNLLQEAFRAHLPVTCIFVAQGFEHLLEPLAIPAETEILLLPRELLDSALTTETPQPIAALVTPFDWVWRNILEGGLDRANRSTPLVLVLAGLQDPGNLGTILRSAEAFGATGVVSLPGTVSAWNPKAVRASAGSVFRLPLLSASTEECFIQLREAGVKVWTTTVHESQPVNLVNLAAPVAFLIGNEGNGVPPNLSAMADSAITIPCPGPVESLNAAVAASILLYEASRQRGSAS
jgi:TrmH family RNA methyltransferase